MHVLQGGAPAQRLRDDEGPLGVDLMQARFDFLVGKRLQRRDDEAVHPHFQRTHGLEQRAFKVHPDGHNLARGLHLGADVLVRIDELVKRPARELEHHVIKRRLGTGIRLPGHAVDDLVQGVAKGNARGDLGDGVARGLGGQRRGTGDTRVDLDHVILHAVRRERVLHVAPAFNPQCGDDVQRCGSQHLVLLVAQRLAGRHDDGIPRVHAHRVEIFHVADGDAVARAVADHFVFDFLPAGHAALNQVFMHAGRAQAVRADLAQLALILRDAAARSAQRIGRAHDDRIAVLVGKVNRRLHIVHDHRIDARLADGEHHVLKILAILRPADGIDLCAQKLHVVAREDALFIQLHGQVQARLPAQGSEQAVRPLTRDDLFKGTGGQRLQIHLIRDVRVGHDGGRVGVDQNHLHALFLEDAAGLRAGVVKLRRLADDDRAGADDQHFFDGFLLWHACVPLICSCFRAPW